MATVLVPLPRQDFDPTEAGVPWRVLTEAGHTVVFATPDGRPARADQRMLRGTDLGLLSPMLRAQANAVADHDRMAQSAEFLAPIAWADIAGGATLRGAEPSGQKAKFRLPLGADANCT